MLTRNLSEIFIQTLEQAVDSVVAIDRLNRVVLFNRSAENLWGLPRDQVIGNNVSLLVPADIRAMHDGFIEANRRTSPNAAFGVFAVVFLLYFLICWPISRLAGYLEKRWS